VRTAKYRLLAGLPGDVFLSHIILARLGRRGQAVLPLVEQTPKGHSTCCLEGVDYGAAQGVATIAWQRLHLYKSALTCCY
jgi:hypothetical protein